MQHRINSAVGKAYQSKIGQRIHKSNLRVHSNPNSENQGYIDTHDFHKVDIPKLYYGNFYAADYLNKKTFWEM